MSRTAKIVSAAAVALVASAGCQTAGGLDERSPYPPGLLPVGDGQFTTEGPQSGYLFTCRGFAESLGSGNPGAAVQGDWFTSDGKWWNPELKPHIRGDIPVPGTFEMSVSRDTRTIQTNSLPVDHTVGEFPVSQTDPAYAVDPNPNSPSAHPQRYDLPAHPAESGTPGCVGHQVGVMTRGAALFSPLDAQGRDAVAWEVQDHCDGHPDPTSTYHYHGMSECLPGTNTPAVIGFALDGFPITGNRDETGREMFSRDLDECHGGVAEVELDGQMTTTYRYAMTRDYPYTVACFRGGATADR